MKVSCSFPQQSVPLDVMLDIFFLICVQLKRVVRAIELISATNVLFTVIVRKWKNIISQINRHLRSFFNALTNCIRCWALNRRLSGTYKARICRSVLLIEVLSLRWPWRRWVSLLHRNVFWFGEAKGELSTTGGLLFGKPPVFFPNITQLWHRARAKIGRACLSDFCKPTLCC